MWWDWRFANRTPEEFDRFTTSGICRRTTQPGQPKTRDQDSGAAGFASLEDGVIFVDTPGLGSLATRGAAETLLFAPLRHGSGSHRRRIDPYTGRLRTIRILYEAAIPATVLLSKADLLGPQDRTRISNT